MSQRQFDRLMPWILIAVGIAIIVIAARMTIAPFDDTRQREPVPSVTTP